MRAFTLLVCLGVALAKEIPDHRQSRIINGREAKAGEVPYQAAVRFYNGNYLCGGASILTPNWVLTSARACPDDLDSMKVYTGSIHLNQNGQDYQMAEVVKHPNYDICLINLKTSIPLNDNVKQVTLPPEDFEVPDNAAVVVSGWGTTNPFDFSENLRMITDYHALSQETCRTIDDTVGFNQICAKGTGDTSGQGPCFGDSGGPLTYNGVQIGIVSMGNMPCASGLDYYTKVSIFVSWIKSIIGTEASLLKIATVSDLLNA